jgi:hypothetical protein
MDFRFAPHFTIEHAGKKVKYLGHVPDFGSPKGTLLIFESKSGSTEEKRMAEALGHAWSVVSSVGFSEFKKEFFQSVLRDWEWSGPSGAEPEWMKRPNQPLQTTRRGCAPTRV